MSRPHHDDIPGYTWGPFYGEPTRPSRSQRIGKKLGFVVSVLSTFAVLGVLYGAIIWVAARVAYAADLVDAPLEGWPALGFGACVYLGLTVIGAHWRAMFSR